MTKQVNQVNYIYWSIISVWEACLTCSLVSFFFEIPTEYAWLKIAHSIIEKKLRANFELYNSRPQNRTIF